MNEEEREIMLHIVDAHNKFIQLKQTHALETQEWVRSIHSLQSLIALRILRRDYPDDFL